MFLPGRVRVGNQEIPFGELVWQAYMARISLSATGFYKTPKIHWDRAAGAAGRSTTSPMARRAARS